LFLPIWRTYASCPDTDDSAPSSGDVWNADPWEFACRGIAVVDVLMSEVINSRHIDKAFRLRIDRDAWLELSIQCSRAVASVGVVGTVLKLAEERPEAERLKCLMAIKDVCIEAHLELTKFANLWAAVDEQTLKEGDLSPEELEKLRTAARQSPTAGLRLSWYLYRDKIISQKARTARTAVERRDFDP
jgi:hypothetical protein